MKHESHFLVYKGSICTPLGKAIIRMAFLFNYNHLELAAYLKMEENISPVDDKEEWERTQRAPERIPEQRLEALITLSLDLEARVMADERKRKLSSPRMIVFSNSFNRFFSYLFQGNNNGRNNVNRCRKHPTQYS